MKLEQERLVQYYFKINQQFPCLSKLELESLMRRYGCGKLVGEFTGILVIEECSDDKAILIQQKSSTLRESGKILTITESDPKNLRERLSFLENYCGYKVHLKLERIQSLGKHFRQGDIIRVIMNSFNKHCKNKSNHGKRGEKQLKAILTDGLLFIAEPLSAARKGDIMKQNPHNLPFYKPGALNPWYARLLVNIASESPSIYYDAFCGTGTIPLAASELWKAESICSDIRRDMCAGAFKNSVELGKDSFINVLRADARMLPIRRHKRITLITDPPYGRSVKSVGADEKSIVQDFIKNSMKYLGEGAKIVLSLPVETAEKLLADKNFSRKVGCLMYVHNRLTRKILVIQND